MQNLASAATAPENTAAADSRRGCALVVDDEPTNRLILKSMLSKHGFDVIQAEDGEIAVQHFREHAIDIVFMDVMMPNMDGYEATRVIKKLSRRRFVPVIFLTAMTDEEALTQCIDAGGDDFLNKPYSKTILYSKVRAMERIRQLHGEVRDMVELMEREEEIAENVFSQAVIADNVALDKIFTELKPAGTFSGDMLLTEYSPSGDLYLLLGDFTGHGLAAALGAMPASEVFRAMTRKGFSGEQILAGINQKLHTMLPTGMFVAVLFVRIHHDLSQVDVINCGMPEALLVSKSNHLIRDRVPSAAMPLGIVRDFNAKTDAVRHLAFKQGDHLFLSSDGLSEAINENEEIFGEQRVEQAINQTPVGAPCISPVMEQLNDFIGSMPPRDDISIVEVPLIAALIPAALGAESGPPVALVADKQGLKGSGWQVSVSLEGKRLDNNPVPLLISQVQELEGMEQQRQALFTILTELYVNALDHGVLGLDSSLKATPDGFARYFEEREQRLAELADGRVAIELNVCLDDDGGRMKIIVEDSGAGFDFSGYALAQHGSDDMKSGRGIKLLLELCDSIEYSDPGNRVEAIFSWQHG